MATRILLLGLTITFASACAKQEDLPSDNFKVFQAPEDPETVILEWTGAIDPPMAQLFSTELEKHQSAKTFVIDLHSPGGDVGEGERVIKAIQKYLPTHSVRTFVGAGNNCLSMCVPIYLQGELRIASEEANFMFHEPISTDPITGDAVFTYDFEQRQSAMEVFNRFFRKSEMDPKWREDLRAKVRMGEVWKTGKELKEERSKVVTLLSENY